MVIRDMGFLHANFQLRSLRPSVLDLGSGTGHADKRTDRQTTATNAVCPTFKLWGGA